MRTTTGACAALALLALTGCTAATQAAPQPTQTATATDGAHSRALSLIHTAYAGLDDSQAEEMMRNACGIIGTKTNRAEVLLAADDLVRQGVGTGVQVTTLIGAAVAGRCPEYLPMLRST